MKVSNLLSKADGLALLNYLLVTIYICVIESNEFKGNVVNNLSLNQWKSLKFLHINNL
jgi:hypothetical protein